MNETMNGQSDTDDPNGDGEGVWSPDIEQCFREALALFPPCGRRKHILQEEGGGKMYGRNELIARHIWMRTGKIRTRKQVSSHIQVLARRKAKTETSKSGADDLDGADSSSPGSSTVMSVGSHGGTHSQQFYENISLNSSSNNNHHNHHQTHQTQQQQQRQQVLPSHNHSAHQLTPQVKQQVASGYFDLLWADRPIATKKIRLVEFSAFIEYRRQPELRPFLPATPGGVASGARSPAVTLASLASVASAAENGHAPVAAAADHHHALIGASPYAGTNPAALSHQPPGQVASPHHASLVVHPAAAAAATTHHIPTAQDHPAAAAAALPAYQQAASLHQPLNNNHQHHQQLNQPDYTVHTMSSHVAALNNPNYHHHHHHNHIHQNLHQPQPQQQQQHLHHHQQQALGLARHSFVKIDYRPSAPQACRQSTKLECIDINQIQDKFPEINGPEGLYQRGPPDAFYLVKFWADMSNELEYNIEDQNSNFGFSCSFETSEPFKDITCSTKACSYGSQVVEKVEKIHGALNSSNNCYSYEIDRSPMCEFMTKFIKKLSQLPRTSQKNSVLENFSVLQVVHSESTSEILLCLAFVFEIASSEQQNGSQYHVYKLARD